MKDKNTEHLQTLISKDTLSRLNKLIMMDALNNDTPIQTRSAWLRNLVEDTIDFEMNKKMIGDWEPKLIKQIKNK